MTWDSRAKGPESTSTFGSEKPSNTFDEMNFKYAGPPPEWLSVLAIYWAIFLAILWFIFSCAVWADADRIERNGYRLRFLSPFWWFLVVLGFTIPGAALYWAANCSSLANLERREPVEDPPAEQGSDGKPDTVAS
jgi:hypothetical protein